MKHSWLKGSFSRITNSKFTQDDTAFFRLDEGFRLASDRWFLLYFQVGFVLSLAYLVYPASLLLSLSLLLLQLIVAVFLFFVTQVSALRMALAEALRLIRSIGNSAHFWYCPPHQSSIAHSGRS